MGKPKRKHEKADDLTKQVVVLLLFLVVIITVVGTLTVLNFVDQASQLRQRGSISSTNSGQIQFTIAERNNQEAHNSGNLQLIVT